MPNVTKQTFKYQPKLDNYLTFIRYEYIIRTRIQKSKYIEERINLSKFKHPAIVIGMSLGGLGVTRSLAKMGVEVFCIDTDVTTAEMKTKQGKIVKFETLEHEKFVDDLILFCQSLIAKPVIFSTNRNSARLLSEHRDKFKHIAFINMPSQKHLAELENKYFIEEYAKQANLCTPITAYVENPYSQESLSNFTYPCIIKPDDYSLEFSYDFHKAKIANSFEEMQTYIDAIFIKIPNIKLVVQEYIAGGDESLFFCLQYRNANNNLISSFVGRKILSWPRSTGRTCSCAPYNGSHHAKITQLTNDFFNSIPDFKGFCSIEFKYDEKRETFYLIEPSVGRTDFQQEIATLNNENIPFKAYLDQVNIQHDMFKPDSLPAQIWYDSSVEKWAKEEAYDTLLDSSFARKSAYFRWRDPMPSVEMIKRKIFNKLAKLRTNTTTN